MIMENQSAHNTRTRFDNYTRLSWYRKANVWQISSTDLRKFC